MPSIKIDSGVKRRIKAHEHKSVFTENSKEVDEKKHIYLMDKDFIENAVNEGLHIAWFQILADNAKEWLEERTIKYPESFNNTKKEITDANDFVQDFIDGSVKITNNDQDRIGKNDMHQEFCKLNPQRHLTLLQLLTSLKERKIGYSGKLRCNGIQGCYYGVRL